MKLSLNWIKDYIDIPDSVALSKLVYDLTMSTVEVEEAVSLKDSFKNIVVGVVREICPHPDADKLVVCKVDLGEKCLADTADGNGTGGQIPDRADDILLREIVCGGINLTEKMKVAVALPGAKVRWHGEGDLIELKKTKVRGVESYGMICASSEIGLFDLFPYTEEATIVDLSAFDAAPGTNLADALGLDDVILTIDNKSLTNRPDLWGHYGVARELSAIYNLQLKEAGAESFLSLSAINNLTPKNPNTQYSQLSIKIADPTLCPRYIGVKIDNVSPKPAPFEMQSRLWRVGVRPINAIVDITNYVMLSVGQPTHAFDADAVKGGIIIRPANDGEKLRLLDGKDLSLTAKDLVIADETEPIALAGVMGGAKDSILPDTRNVILEIANFNPLTVRRTSMRYDVRTEAAARYEKGIDPQRAGVALDIAIDLFKALYPEMKVTAHNDNYPQPLKCNEIDVSLTWLTKRLGQTLSTDRMTGILERLGIEASIKDDNMHVLVPSWRSTGDISLPDDIMEEIARIYGLENFEPAPIISVFTGAVSQPEIEIDRKIREYLAKTCGMNEVFTYPWISEEYLKAIQGTHDKNMKQPDTETFKAGMLEMSSPPSPGERYLRKSLIPGICKAVAENLRYFSEFSIFESAQVFFDKDYTSPYDERESLPAQRRHVTGAFVAPRDKFAVLYRLAKGALEAMPRQIHIKPLELQTETQNTSVVKPYWADEVIHLAITVCDEQIGDIALLSQKAALACGIKNVAVMLFEMDIDMLEPLPSRENTYKRIPEYPMTEYDISLLFDTAVKWVDIENTARGKEGPDNLLYAVDFVDEYKGNQIPAGKKSVTIRLTIGSSKKTLTSDEIESCVNSATKRLVKTLGAEARA